MKKILVCGGRDFMDDKFVYHCLMAQEDDIDLIIHGGASGVDTYAGRFAAEFGIPCAVFPAHWDTFGRAAGPLRNEWMIKISRPTLVIAFPGGRGTASMVKLAKKAKVETLVISYGGK